MVVQIDPVALTETARVYLGGSPGDPYGICYANGKLFVGRFNTQDIVVVDPVANTVLAYITTPITNGPCDITFYFGSMGCQLGRGRALGD